MSGKANMSPNLQLRRYIALARILTRHRFGLTKDEIIEKLREEDIAPPSHRTFQRDIEKDIYGHCGVIRRIPDTTPDGATLRCRQ